MADTGDPEPRTTPLQPEDVALLAAFVRGSSWLRALLCTLARRGAALRLADPERAAALIAALAPAPLFKGGQFLFDLLELEDFLLDGPPPPLLPATLDAAALARLAELLHRFQAHLDGSAATAAKAASVDLVPEVVLVAGGTAESLPELAASFDLYHDVVLGVAASAGPLLRAHTAGA